MKDQDTIASDINAIVQSHYYSEDFELVSSIRAYADRLSRDESDILEQVVLQRLMHDGSIVDVLLCSVIKVPSAVPILARRLQEEDTSNQITRTLISALRTYSNDEAYTAVERFIDSDQEMETLQALAQIDFVRTLPVMARLMQKDHYQGVVLHIVYDRMKTVGMDQLIGELTSSTVTTSANFRESLAKSLKSKKEPYNPFSEPEIMRIISHVSAA